MIMCFIKQECVTQITSIWLIPILHCLAYVTQLCCDVTVLIKSSLHLDLRG